MVSCSCNVALNWLVPLRSLVHHVPFVLVPAPQGCPWFLPHAAVVWVDCEGAWLLRLAWWKRGDSWYRRLCPSHMATLTLQVIFGRAVDVTELSSHPSQKPRPSDAWYSLKKKKKKAPFRHLSSLALLFVALSVFIYSRFPCCVWFFSFSSAVHTFPEHLFPLALRQLNIATGADSSAS